MKAAGRKNAHLLNNPDSGKSTGADKSALGTINRPLLCMDELVNLHNWVHTFVCYTPRLARLGVVFFVDDARADVFLPVDA